MIERYLNIAREVIDLSLKQGAEQVSVSLANATSFQLEVRNQNIEALKEAGSSGIHVTLAKTRSVPLFLPMISDLKPWNL